MNVLEIQKHTGCIYLWRDDRYVGLHSKDWVASGVPAMKQDGVYGGRVFVTLDDHECQALLWTWFDQGPIDLKNQEHEHRIPEGVMERINIHLKKLAA